MKKVIFFSTAALVVLAYFSAFAQMGEMQKVDTQAELAKSIEKGKALFTDASLGTNGMTCNNCHMQGGSMDGKMGEKTIKAFDNVASQYPKYFMMGKKVMTLDQVVNFCITNPLKGKALSADDQKLTDLVAYVASVRPMKMEKMGK